MRISDWSSDVCSSDLFRHLRPGGGLVRRRECPCRLHAGAGALRGLRPRLPVSAIRRRLATPALAHGEALAGRVVLDLENLVGRPLMAVVDDPLRGLPMGAVAHRSAFVRGDEAARISYERSEDHTSELQ